MAGLIERLSREGTTRAEARRLAKPGERRAKGRPRHFVFRFGPRGSEYSMSLQFKRSQVEKAEIIRTLESILESLRAES